MPPRDPGPDMSHAAPEVQQHEGDLFERIIELEGLNRPVEDDSDDDLQFEDLPIRYEHYYLRVSRYYDDSSNSSTNFYIQTQANHPILRVLTADLNVLDAFEVDTDHPIPESALEHIIHHCSSRSQEHIKLTGMIPYVPRMKGALYIKCVNFLLRQFIKTDPKLPFAKDATFTQFKTVNGQVFTSAFPRTKVTVSKASDFYHTPHGNSAFPLSPKRHPYVRLQLATLVGDIYVK